MIIGKQGMVGGKSAAPVVVDPYALPQGFPQPLARYAIEHPSTQIFNNTLVFVKDLTDAGNDLTQPILASQPAYPFDVGSGTLRLSAPIQVTSNQTQLCWVSNPFTLGNALYGATITSWFDNNYIRVEKRATDYGIFTSAGFGIQPANLYIDMLSSAVLLYSRTELLGGVAPTYQYQAHAGYVNDSAQLKVATPNKVSSFTGTRAGTLNTLGEPLYGVNGLVLHEYSLHGSLLSDQQILDYYNATKGNYGL